MSTDALKRLVNVHGFVHTMTGGNCSAYAQASLYQNPDLITDGDARAPTHDEQSCYLWLGPECGVGVGFPSVTALVEALDAGRHFQETGEHPVPTRRVDLFTETVEALRALVRELAEIGQRDNEPDSPALTIARRTLAKADALLAGQEI